MKTIYIIIATFYVGLFTKAQQSELINNTWYLQKMINSNGVEMLSPNNNEVNYVIANFGNSEMNTKVIYEFYGSLFGSGTGALTPLLFMLNFFIIITLLIARYQKTVYFKTVIFSFLVMDFL